LNQRNLNSAAIGTSLTTPLLHGISQSPDR
jgi:hypothetical protein